MRVRMWKEIQADLRQHGLRSGGFWALLVYRYGRWSLERSSGKTRWCTSKLYGACRPIVQFVTGVDIDRKTKIGDDFHIVHAGNISVHPDAVIGNRVGIMHGVTIGTNMGSEVPVIGDDVFIGCNASVLGGIKVGNGARIAANSLVITDVPAGAVAIGVPARVGPDLSALRREGPRLAPAPAAPASTAPPRPPSPPNGKAGHG